MTDETQAQATMTAEGAPPPAQDSAPVETGVKTGEEPQGQDAGATTGGTVKHTRIGGPPPAPGDIDAQLKRLDEKDAQLDAGVKALSEELGTLQPAEAVQNMRLRCGPADRRLGFVKIDAQGNATATRMNPRQMYDLELAPGEHLVICHLSEPGGNLRQFLRAAGIEPAASGEPQ